MSDVAVTGANQWWSTTNDGPKRPDSAPYPGNQAMLSVRANGSTSHGTICTVRRRLIGDSTWSVVSTILNADLPVEVDITVDARFEWDIGVATGEWQAGDTLTVGLP